MVGFDDEVPLVHAHDPPSLGENDLDDAGVLVELAADAFGRRRCRDPAQIDDSAFGLGDGLLANDEQVALADAGGPGRIGE